MFHLWYSFFHWVYFLKHFSWKMQVRKTSIIWGENLDLYGFYIKKGLQRCISFAVLILIFLWNGSYLWTIYCLSCVSRPLKLLMGITACRNVKTESSSCFSYRTDFSFFMAESLSPFNWQADVALVLPPYSLAHNESINWICKFG